MIHFIVRISQKFLSWIIFFSLLKLNKLRLILKLTKFLRLFLARLTWAPKQCHEELHTAHRQFHFCRGFSLEFSIFTLFFLQISEIFTLGIFFLLFSQISFNPAAAENFFHVHLKLSEQRKRKEKIFLLVFYFYWNFH